MSDLAQITPRAPSEPSSDDLAEGNLFVELQVSAWPPPVTHAQLGLTVNAKPSGRLRVELLRATHDPVICGADLASAGPRRLRRQSR